MDAKETKQENQKPSNAGPNSALRFEGWTRHGGSCTNSTHDGGLVFQGRRGPGTRAVSHTDADDKNGEEASFYRCLVPSFNL